MKKFINIFTLFILVLALGITPIKANETIDSVYDAELENAIISGDGSEDNPYIVDYSKAPNFKKYVVDVYQNAKGTTKSRNTGFTGFVFTVRKGTYSSGGMWIYNSGGMSVSSDGNWRIVKATYSPVDQVHKLYAAMNSPTAWGLITSGLTTLSSSTREKVINTISNKLINNGISSIGGYSVSSIASATATTVGAISHYVAVALFISSVVNAWITTPIRNASNNDLTFVHISYLSSYHGSWYQNSTGEAGWASNVIYTPSSTYGSGTFISG